MSQLNERGARSERSSALWGTGGRGGDRSSVLWGKGGRGMVVMLVLTVALAAPLAAQASYRKLAPTWNRLSTPAPTAPGPASTPAGVPNASNGTNTSNFVATQLVQTAQATPEQMVSVIIMASGGFTDSKDVEQWLSGYSDKVTNDGNLNVIGGVALKIPASLVTKLQAVPGLTVVPDAPVQLSGSVGAALPTTTQLWPYASGNQSMWQGDQTLYKGQLPAIAIVDSGIQPRSDFGNRVIASVNLSTIDGNDDMNDDDGHGTFVAGIAAGDAPGLAGAAPGAPLVSIKVMDSEGQALTSDIIQACQWILDNKDQYNIKVANFSLHSSYSTNFWRDPLDQAVEQLWFNGVTVVAAAGNYGISNTQPSGVLYSPGNDPFVITVGALDINGTATASDDEIAPWSAWGYTPDGFAKPEISAPGRYMVGPIPSGSTITTEKPQNMVGDDEIQLSGTSFSAPVVSGTVAEILARHPDWTPDQIKGDLMQTGRSIASDGDPMSAGLGALTATTAAAATFAPNANLGLDQYVADGVNGVDGPSFDAMSWVSDVQSDMSWNSMSWADQSWTSMSWADQSWSDMSWADQSWSDMSWTDMSWTDMSWADMSQEDAAEGDGLSGAAGYQATPDQIAAALSDPSQVNVDNIPGTDDPSTSDACDASSTDSSSDGTSSDGTTSDSSSSDGTADTTTCDSSTDGTATGSSSDGTATDSSSDGTATDSSSDGTATDSSSDGTASDGSTSDSSAGDSSSDGTTGNDQSDTSSSAGDGSSDSSSDGSSSGDSSGSS